MRIFFLNPKVDRIWRNKKRTKRTRRIRRKKGKSPDLSVEVPRKGV